MASIMSIRNVLSVSDLLDNFAGNTSQHMLVNSTESSGVTARDDVTTQHDATSRDRLIPDGLMLYVTLYLSIVIPIVISAFGTVTNVINLIIFSKMGVKDSMTVGLWALSLSDLLVTVQTLGSSVCYLANITTPSKFMNPILIQYVSLCWSQDLMYLVSNWITTFISLERCYCVINPFKVRATFTRNRSIAAVVFIYVFHIGSYLPIFATHKLDWASDDASNFSNSSTVMVVSYGANRATIHHAVDILNGAVLPVIQQALVIGSAVCLSYGLKASSKVRKHKQGDDVKRQSMLSQKESRLVTVVVFLAIILTVCNTPRFVAVYATLLIPEMYIGRLYENVYVFLWALTALFASLNASVNICVYLLVNLSFRSRFKQLMCPSSSIKTMSRDSDSPGISAIYK